MHTRRMRHSSSPAYSPAPMLTWSLTICSTIAWVRRRPPMCDTQTASVVLHRGLASPLRAWASRRAFAVSHQPPTTFASPAADVCLCGAPLSALPLSRRRFAEAQANFAEPAAPLEYNSNNVLRNDMIKHTRKMLDPQQQFRKPCAAATSSRSARRVRRASRTGARGDVATEGARATTHTPNPSHAPTRRRARAGF